MLDETTKTYIEINFKQAEAAAVIITGLKVSITEESLTEVKLFNLKVQYIGFNIMRRL